VHNITVSNLRSSGPPSAALTEVDASRGADEEAEQRMEARDALAGIAALPELQRDVMVRTVVDGLSHEELASELGLSRGAVRGLIYRARARLRAAAAVCIPGLVIEWAARRGHGGSSPAAGIHEVIAGGGSAGVGGFLFKSSAVVATAGAVATAVGITGDRVHPRNDGAGAGASEGTQLDKPTVRSATAAGKVNHAVLRSGAAPQPTNDAAVTLVAIRSRRSVSPKGLGGRLQMRTVDSPRISERAHRAGSGTRDGSRSERAPGSITSRERSWNTSFRDESDRRSGHGGRDGWWQPSVVAPVSDGRSRPAVSEVRSNGWFDGGGDSDLGSRDSSGPAIGAWPSGRPGGGSTANRTTYQSRDDWSPSRRW
jgi:Sigma-70, region 4